MRRGPDDEKWQAVKKKVKELDAKGCIFCRCMTPQEYILQEKSVKEQGYVNKEQFYILDPAHHIAVSDDASIMYDVDNVYLVCRFHHDRIDYRIHPFTGERISKEEQEELWQRAMKVRYEEKAPTKQGDDLFYDPL